METLPVTTAATNSLQTRMSGPNLPDKLHNLVMGSDNPIVGPNTALQLAAFAAEPEPPLASRDQVGVMIGKLALATAQPKTTEAEAGERIELYWLALNDIPVADLRAAFSELIRIAKFLPTPAEVRRAALVAGSPRKYAKSRARHLAWKHSVEWKPPVDAIPEAEVRALLASVNLAAEA